ncbi:MAG: hypothetical protein L6264_13370 [Weeksellaceae bacterium]|nr:hypothetical protein [Weeksellaceae bacterium]
MHPFEGISVLDANQNIMVEYAKYTCPTTKCECEFSLADYKNVELDLVVPKALK